MIVGVFVIYYEGNDRTIVECVHFRRSRIVTLVLVSPSPPSGAWDRPAVQRSATGRERWHRIHARGACHDCKGRADVKRHRGAKHHREPGDETVAHRELHGRDREQCEEACVCYCAQS